MSSDLRLRSRSPHREREPLSRSTRHRSRSPHRSDKTSSHTKRKQRHVSTSTSLPFGAGGISKHETQSYRPMFALYLDIQKQLDIDELPEDEVKGRWKSFVGKWNRGDLAEGWYDPSTLRKAVAAEQQQAQEEQDHDEEHMNIKDTAERPHTRKRNQSNEHGGADEEQRDDDDEDDDFGPAMPPDTTTTIVTNSYQPRQGPNIPTLQDLRSRNEQAREDFETNKQLSNSAFLATRKADRNLQSSRLDDLTPRAEPGSRERMLENKRLKADSNRSFAASAQAGGDVEMKDTDVMGDEDSLADLKRTQKESERKKNEREIRKEEVLRARMAEREERMKGLREKENKTMDMLRKIAEARFGGTGSRD